MKKKNSKSLNKAVKKDLRSALELCLIANLTTLIPSLGSPSKKMEKRIRKGSGKLAKKLAREIKVGEAALMATGSATAIEVNGAKVAAAPKLPVMTPDRPTVKARKIAKS